MQTTAADSFVPPLVPVAVVVTLGVLLGQVRPVPGPALLVLGLGCASLQAVCWRRGRTNLILLLALWLIVGVLRSSVWAHRGPSDVRHLVSEQAAPVIVHARVVDDPVELFSPSEASRQSCVLELRHVRTQAWHDVSGRIRARLQQPRVQVWLGDEVLIEGRWVAVPGPMNPGQYDWRAALARQRIDGLLSVAGQDAMVRLDPNETLRSARSRLMTASAWASAAWNRAINRVRRRWEALIDGQFDDRHAGLLRSLLLGERVALDEDLKRAFVETGTMHLLVISGFNVGLIAWLLEMGLRLAGMPFRLRLGVCAVALAGYCALTGSQPPVMRSTIMAWIVLGGIWLDRVVNWPNALATASLAILLLDPAQIGDAGFQLSFGAVVSLLLFAPAIQRRLESVFGRRTSPTGSQPFSRDHPARLPWLTRHVTLSLASTAAVWIGLWPVLAWYFHLVSPVSMLANLVLVPLVSLLVGVGTVILTLGMALEPLVHVTGFAMHALVDATLWSVHLFHHVPGGCWLVGHPSAWLIAGYYALLGMSLARRRLHLPHGWLLACWLLGINCWLWSAILTRAIGGRWLEFTALDVGHGDSLVIRTPDRHTLLVDTGTREAGRSVVVPYLRFRGIGQIDAFVLTHPDEDHLGGALAVLAQTRVKRLITNGFDPPTPTAVAVLELARARHVPHDVVAAGMRVAGIDGVLITVLHPPPGLVPGTESRSNDNSIVLQIRNGSVSFLLCGDLEERGVPWLLGWGARIRSTVLKVPHHGSALGIAEHAFFERVHPEVAVLSVGWLHGLPSAQVVKELREIEARTLLTRQSGAITIRTDGSRVMVETFGNKQTSDIRLQPSDSRLKTQDSRGTGDRRPATPLRRKTS